MDKLRTYLNGLSADEQAIFAFICSTSIGYLRKAISKGSLPSPALCVLVETHSGMNVTRKDLRPDDWHLIWPELIEAA